MYRGCLSENSEGVKIGDSELTQSFLARILLQIPSGYGKFQTRRSACAKKCSRECQLGYQDYPFVWLW